MAARRLLWAEAGETRLKPNSEKDKEGGWRCDGPFLGPKSVCSSPSSWGGKQVIWKDILMSLHSALLELPLLRDAEFSDSLQHPFPSAMALKTSSQHNPFSLMVLHRSSLCCGKGAFLSKIHGVDFATVLSRWKREYKEAEVAELAQSPCVAGAASPVVSLGTSVKVV